MLTRRSTIIFFATVIISLAAAQDRFAERTHKSNKPVFRTGIDTSFVIDGDTFFLKDLSHVLEFVISQSDSTVHEHEHGSNYDHWRRYLRLPHPNVSTVKRYFDEASIEFDVPVHILYSIGLIENNWTQIGPSIDQGWGIMHLVENHYCNTLLQAASLIDATPQELKDNARQNIRGAAALLAIYAGEERESFTSYEQWHPAMMRFSGLVNVEIQHMQLQEYLRILHQGSHTTTLWDEELILLPQPKSY